MKLYVVHLESGKYDTYGDTPIKYFLSEKSAEDFVNSCKDEILEINKNYGGMLLNTYDCFDGYARLYIHIAETED